MDPNWQQCLAAITVAFQNLLWLVKKCSQQTWPLLSRQGWKLQCILSFMSAGSLSENYHILAIKPHQPSYGPVKEEHVMTASICSGMKSALCWKAFIASLCCSCPASFSHQLPLLRPSLCQGNIPDPRARCQTSAASYQGSPALQLAGTGAGAQMLACSSQRTCCGTVKF